ncbi:hypothetical protein TNCV_1072201 [Trichonephila clavipes]|nr:hypothetical protein TNCV_1072201 [Trichonephila clavipes]
MNLEKFCWEWLEYTCCSLDLSPCVFHIFSPLQKDLQEKHFYSSEEEKEVVQESIRIFLKQRHKVAAETMELVLQRPWQFLLISTKGILIRLEHLSFVQRS